MQLNEAQHELIKEFAKKFCDHSITGHIHPSCHITDVRKLIEACVKANTQTPTEVDKPKSEVKEENIQ